MTGKLVKRRGVKRSLAGFKRNLRTSVKDMGSRGSYLLRVDTRFKRDIG